MRIKIFIIILTIAFVVLVGCSGANAPEFPTSSFVSQISPLHDIPKK